MSNPPSASEEEEEDRFLKTEFLERIAHELRGPSGVTLGALDELELALSSGNEVRVQALLSMARRGARRVLRTADRLSRSAQLEAGTASVTPFPIDLRGLVSRATLEASDTEGRSSVTVTTELADHPCMAAADAGWLGAAVAELVGQAIRAASRAVRVHVFKDGDQICVSVTDDRAAQLETARARFVRHGTRRDMGLDLPLVHDVARMHGSELVLDLHDGQTEPRSVTVCMRLAATK